MRLLTRYGPIYLIEGCPLLNIQGISLPLSGLMGRVNNIVHSCQDASGIPMLPRLLQFRLGLLHSSVEADGKSMCFPCCWLDLYVSNLIGKYRGQETLRWSKRRRGRERKDAADEYNLIYIQGLVNKRHLKFKLPHPDAAVTSMLSQSDWLKKLT